VSSVAIDCYRRAGRWLCFRIRKRCEACDLTYAVLNQLLNTVFGDKPVSLRVQPWLDNWWRIIGRGAWHAPIVLINGRLFSQGVLPNVPSLIREVAAQLGDPELEDRAAAYAPRPKPAPGPAEVVVYSSPACPHCHRLRGWLDANNIAHVNKNVSQSMTARDELKGLTGKLFIPVTIIGEQIITGVDKSTLRRLLKIDPTDERSEISADTVRVPHASRQQVLQAVEDAKALLEANCHDGRTRASRHLYPHQWNWDAGFIARGYLNYDPPKAYREIWALFSAQWSDGFLPHIVFNPDYLDHFPGTDYWKAKTSGRVPAGIHTSGISQPAVHASMLCVAPRLDPDKDRALSALQEIYPRIRKLHDFFFESRDPHAENLVCIVHPWESGLDNTPIWDEPLGNITESSAWAREMQRTYDELAARGNRPKRTYIEKYSYLVESLFSRNYAWPAIMAAHPFLIQDVLFNAVLCRAERDLGRIAESIGMDPAPHVERSEAMAAAINAKLWDDSEGLYYSFDMVSGKLIKRDTIFSYLPLYAGICDQDRARRLMDNLRSHCFCVADRNCVGIPTYDMCRADYEGEFYWRGPVWYNMCWYMVDGLRQYGMNETADWIRDSMLQLVVEHGFYEYYEPETGKGLGADSFSWTAALFIDLARM
jgi:glutaredoxin